MATGCGGLAMAKTYTRGRRERLETGDTGRIYGSTAPAGVNPSGGSVD